MIPSTLKRYSKPRGAGDQTSGGRGKLLRATSALSRLELLVRETLQNSWDAKLEGWTPAYGVRVYRMDEDLQETLREHVFTDLPESLADLADSLRKSNVHAVEIYDRGTTGLDGPYRASAVAAEGEPNNFNSFVFDIGTTKASESSGGTYGFGKTATFEVSRAHSVVYWSRCRGTDGEVEHRLIACSLHDPYQEGNQRFTGAHWWGDPADDDIVPLRGQAAEELGERIFRTHFGETEDGDPETGTSILILDPMITVDAGDELGERVPVRTQEHSEVLLEQVSDALAHSAWPKVVPTSSEDQPMIVEMHENRIERPVSASMTNRYGIFAAALTEIRREQGQLEEDLPPSLPVGTVRVEMFPIRIRPRGRMLHHLSEFFGESTDNVVGHLYLIESVASSTEPETNVPANALCLMRSDAELVVRYDRVTEMESDYLQWHGVFKPTTTCDRHFAAAEPPTHDRWTPNAAESEASTYIVRKVLEQIRTKTRNFLSENKAQGGPAQTRSVRGVAMGLRSFVPLGALDESVDEEDSPRRQARRSGGAKAGPRTSVELIGQTTLPNGSGQVLDLAPRGQDDDRLALTATICAITAEGRLPLGDDDVSVRWVVDGTEVGRGTRCVVAAGSRTQLQLTTRTPAALDIALETEVAG